MPEKLIRSLDDNQPMQATSSSAKPLLAIIIALALVLGIGTGYVLSGNVKPGTSTKSTTDGKANTSGKTSAGIADSKAYPDPAEGILREGGIEGEGSFHLERPGGKSQNVYLTSSTVDLSEFLGKKVKVMGQTFNSQKAGWLMDVGYIELQ